VPRPRGYAAAFALVRTGEEIGVAKIVVVTLRRDDNVITAERDDHIENPTVISLPILRR